MNKKDFKVLLINPPQTFPEKYYSAKEMRVSIPIGLMSVAAKAEESGFNVSILDAITLRGEPVVYEGSSEIRLGCSYEKLREEIRKREPDVIGITSPYSAQFENTLKTAMIVRELFPSVILVGGGPHASVKAEEYFENSLFDFVILAEGENAFAELLGRFSKGRVTGNLNFIPNLVYREGERLVRNDIEFIKELDSLPFPAYHMVDLERYFELFKQGFSSRAYANSERVMPLITSRGCPFNCIFCSIHSHMGRLWRFHSAEYVLNHLKLLVEKYRLKHISFEDDNLSVNLKRFEEIVNGIIVRRKKSREWKFAWDTPNGVRADTLTESVLKKAKEAGLHFLVIAIESGDQDVLDNIIDKKLDLNSAIEVAKWCHKLGINLGTFFVIGFPGETRENIQKTFDLAFLLNRKYSAIPSIALATPLLNTKLYEIVKENNYLTAELTGENLLTATMVTGKGLIKTKDFTPEELSQWSNSFYRKLMLYQLLKPGYIIKKFITSPKTLAGMVKKAIMVSK